MKIEVDTMVSLIGYDKKTVWWAIASNQIITIITIIIIIIIITIAIIIIISFWNLTFL